MWSLGALPEGFPAAYAAYAAAGRGGYSGYPSFGLPYPTGYPAAAAYGYFPTGPAPPGPPHHQPTAPAPVTTPVSTTERSTNTTTYYDLSRSHPIDTSAPIGGNNKAIPKSKNGPAAGQQPLIMRPDQIYPGDERVKTYVTGKSLFWCLSVSNATRGVARL
ncbi:hypothetical protein M8J75_001897 [Diaphorina citri]|nr:hypothetical protein M8J75_001897 [Diaphorina citri]